jgi:FixJ family two-component response regulator
MVFLIDDDKSVQRAFEILLKSAGVDYHACENADEYLSLNKQDTKDVIVLDLNLPGMKGTELLKKFIHDDFYIPVIVVTAFDDPSSRIVCKEFGVKAFLRKPVDGEALLDLIKYNLPS